MRYFATQSNYLLIMSDLPDSPIWCFRPAGPFRTIMQYALSWNMRKLNQSRVLIWPSENSFAILIPKIFLHRWHFNDYLTNLRTLVSWNLKNQLREGPKHQEQIDMVVEFFMVHFDARVRVVSKQQHLGLGRFGRPFSCFDAFLTRTSGCTMKSSSTCRSVPWSREPFPNWWFRIQGTSVLNCSSSRLNVSRAGIFFGWEWQTVFGSSYAHAGLV